MIAIRYNDNGNIERIEQISRVVRNPRGMLAAVGREGVNRLKGHFRKKDRDEPNKLGGRREHFWLKVSRSVQSPSLSPDGSAIVIVISHPAIAQKVFGGRITAKRTRNLSIPVDPEAYGRFPATFEAETGLQLIFIKQGKNALLATQAGNAGLRVRYILTPSVNQEPDPTALPPQDQFVDALVARAESVLRRETEGTK